jgi:hypothetical protein
MPVRQSNKPDTASGRKEAGGSGAASPSRLTPLWDAGIGNRAMGRLFEERIGPPDDPFEREADRAASTVSRGGLLRDPLFGGARPAAGGIQRKCAECELDEEEKIRRAPKEGEVAPAEVPAERATPAAEPASPEAAQAETQPSAQEKAAPGLLVDDAAQAKPGQMDKGEFLTALRTAVCATANEALARSGRDSEGCPWVDYWFAYYEGRDAAQVERALRHYAPGAGGAATAEEYIPLVTARVRRSVDVWAKTGEITGVPEDLPAAMPGGPVLDSFGGMFFKSQPGGPRQADPISVRNRLGTGQSLPGGLRSRMESAFGTSFSGVRLHDDSTSAQLSGQLNARAFTIGQHVAFGAGEFRPGSIAGDALIAHELAHVMQQGGATGPVAAGKSERGDAALESDADRSAVGAVSSLWEHLPGNVIPLIKSGLRLQRCKSERQKEIDRLGTLQYGFMEEKRKKEEERLRKEAEEEAKNKGLEPPKAPPKVDMGDVIKKDVEKHALKGSPTAEWDNADKPAWKARAAKAWTDVVASVKGTELESVAKGVTFDFNPKAALEGGFYAQQDGHTLRVGMSWVRFAEMDPKNVWENLAHEMAGHFEYGQTYTSEIMDAALSTLSSDERKRFGVGTQGFFEAYEYPETEIYASLWQRRYRVPVAGAERPSGGIHPDENILKRLHAMQDNLHPEVAKAVLKILKGRIDANPQILQRDKDFFVEKVKEVFKYTP